VPKNATRRAVVLVSAWAGVTLVTAAVAWGVVRLAGGGITDTALQPLSAAQVEAMGTTTVPAGTPGDPSQAAAPTTAGGTAATVTPAPGATPPGSPSASTTTAPPVTTTAPPVTTTASAPPASANSSTTIVPPPSSTIPAPTITTTTAVAGGTRAFTYPEGTVVVRFDQSGVTLVSASPAPGFSVDVDEAGPPSVDLDFEAGDDEARFRAGVADGELIVTLDRDD
jgi:hypothetical protein